MRSRVGSTVSSGSTDTTVAPHSRILAVEAGIRGNASLDDESHDPISGRPSEDEVRSIPHSRSGTFGDSKEAHRSVRDSLLSWGRRSSGFTRKEADEPSVDLIPSEEQDKGQEATHAVSEPEPLAVKSREESICESTGHAALSDAAQGLAPVSDVDKEVDISFCGAKDRPSQNEPQQAAVATNEAKFERMARLATPVELKPILKDSRVRRDNTRQDKVATNQKKHTSLSEKRSNTSLIPAAADNPG